VTLEDMLALCAKSKAERWKVIPCSGPGTGPSFLDAWVAGPDGEPLLAGSHTVRAVYRPDMSLSLAWGLVAHDPFVESWTEEFDEPASSHYVDFFWNGALVERGLYVAVDGGRCKLPIPQRDLDRLHPAELWITRWQHQFFQLLNACEGVADIDEHLQKAGIRVR
jgi:hypothetical protein